MTKKRWLYVAGGVILVLVIGTILLLSGGKKDASEATAEAVVYPRWEYTTVIAQCQYDRGSKDVVCATSEGESWVSNLLAQKGAEGWELASSFTATGSGNTVTAFAFKRLVDPE